MTTHIQVSDHSVQFAIQAWLHEKQGRTGSVRTAGEYARNIRDFRHALQSGHTDLDGDTRAVALLLQAWSARSTRGGSVSASTANSRCACVSSFYRYCIRQGLLGITQNPAERVARRPVQGFQKAVPLSFRLISDGLGSINRKTIQGQRDYALLAITFVTGRRLSELRNLCWEDVTVDEEGIILTWRRTKGGKVMRDRLPHSVGKALMDYRAALMLLPSLRSLVVRTQDARSSMSPVWISFAKNSPMRQLSVKALERICQKHLGTPKFHALRHSFAHAMEDAGAKVSHIQHRLGHASIATTGTYLAAMRGDENEYARTLADMIGLRDDT